VLVSGLLSSRGPPAGILNLIVGGSVIVVLDTRMFDEYSEVLRRKKFAFPEEAVREILAFIRREGLFIPPVPVTCMVPDPGDLPFIEVALHARVPIVTGNIRHFRNSGAMVITPAEFLEQYRNGDLSSL
jgi:predicted nucleic acid-binding protein